MLIDPILTKVTTSENSRAKEYGTEVDHSSTLMNQKEPTITDYNEMEQQYFLSEDECRESLQLLTDCIAINSVEEGCNSVMCVDAEQITSDHVQSVWPSVDNTAVGDLTTECDPSLTMSTDYSEQSLTYCYMSPFDTECTVTPYGPEHPIAKGNITGDHLITEQEFTSISSAELPHVAIECTVEDSVRIDGTSLDDAEPECTSIQSEFIYIMKHVNIIENYSSTHCMHVIYMVQQPFKIVLPETIYLGYMFQC